MFDFSEYDLLNFQNSKRTQTKLEKILNLIPEVCKDKKKIGLSFSGGKDSLVCFLLLKKCNIDFEVVWFNSGYEYPETKEFIETLCNKYDVPLRIIEPLSDPLKAKIEAGFFDLDKINKANKKILLPWHSTNKEYDLVVTGIRIQESKVRKMTIRRNGQYFFNKSYKAFVLYPVAYFDTDEIFSLIAFFGEKYHPLYYKAKTIKERAYLRVNWYIFSIAEGGYYVFLKREYPEQFYNLLQYLPEIRNYV